MYISSKKIVFQFVIFLLIFSFSCEENNTTDDDLELIIEEDTNQDNDTNSDETLPKTTQIVIDSTDLKILPIDNGGIHTAYPLGTTNAPFGHYVYTPEGYEENGPEYPLLLFLHGWDPSGYTGTDEQELDELLVGGTPPGLINANQWNPSFPFIVASPRLKFSPYWLHYQIHDFIEYIIENYQINTSRIYLTGLSLGGGGSWYYVGERGMDNYIAAMVPICGRGEERIIDNLIDTPIWAFHGARDNTVLAYENYGSVPLVEAINSKNPKVKAKVTVFTTLGHNVWDRTYKSQFLSYNIQRSPFDVSIYDWMLQYKKE